MSVLNDDGVPLDLTVVFILFAIPNFMFIILTILNAYLLYLSKEHSRLNNSLGKIANFFAKGALDRIIRNMIKLVELRQQQQQQQEQIQMLQQPTLNMPRGSIPSKKSRTSTFNLSFERKYDANYLLLVPFQIDILLTVLIYKILTRDVYPETCQTYLTTYYNRPTQVVCWLKTINRNISNLSFNLTLHQYCTNQSITYINYVHNDVICIHYVFRLINIIDTVTNMFAWHQAVVFVVTKSIVFSYWYQHKLHKTLFWSKLFTHQRRCILSFLITSILSIYIVIFVFILPIRFFLFERRRVDLTRHLLYACFKFITAIILHVNIYTLYQWHSLTEQKQLLLASEEQENKEEETICHQLEGSFIAMGNGHYSPPPSSMMVDDNLGTSPNGYLAADFAV